MRAAAAAFIVLAVLVSLLCLLSPRPVLGGGRAVVSCGEEC